MQEQLTEEHIKTLDYVEYRLARLKARLGELEQHQKLFNRARRKYEKKDLISRILYRLSGFVGEGSDLSKELEIIQLQIEVMNHAKVRLEEGHQIRSVIQDVENKLPHDRQIVTGLNVAGLGLI